mgnify:CR=1 FL=1
MYSDIELGEHFMENINTDCSTSNISFDLKSHLRNRADLCFNMAKRSQTLTANAYVASHKAREVWLMVGTPMAKDAAKYKARVASEEFKLGMSFLVEAQEIEILLKNM